MTEEQRAWLLRLPVGGFISNRLKFAIQLAGIDMTEMARRTGLRAQYISIVAGGRVKGITLNNAVKIASALGFKAEELFPHHENNLP